MYSSYDKAYRDEPLIQHPPTYSTPISAPIIITIDNYTLPEDDAKKPKYVFDFDGTEGGVGLGAIRDVVSIELIHANVPITDDELYTILRVNDYSRVRSNNTLAKNSFCLIANQNPAMDTYYSVRRIGSTPDDNLTYFFPEPTKLNKLEIEFASPSGATIEFYETAEDAAAAGHAVRQILRYILTFEIRTLNRAPPKPDFRFNQPVKGPW